MSSRVSIFRKALLAGAVVTGAGLGAAGIASAASSSGTSSTSGTATASTAGGSGSAAAPSPVSGSPVNPEQMTHGPGETLLTGANLLKATSAAKAAVPGATVIRAETDSSGASTYEVHMKKSDGTDVTVELDSSFKVVKTVSGFGAGPSGSQAPEGMGGPGSGHGAPPGAAPSSAAA